MSTHPNVTESNMPLEYLEELASDQRRNLHNSVQRLRHATRDRLDLKRNLREYFWPAAGVAGLAGLVLGFSVTSIFTDR